MQQILAQAAVRRLLRHGSGRMCVPIAALRIAVNGLILRGSTFRFRSPMQLLHHRWISGVSYNCSEEINQVGPDAAVGLSKQFIQRKQNRQAGQPRIPSQRGFAREGAIELMRRENKGG